VFLAAITGIGPGWHELFCAKTFTKFLNGIQLTGPVQVGFALFGN
jgi:hypothetical protein